MTLIAITRPFNRGTVWINPEYVLCVRETYIGHKTQGIIGTRLLVNGMTWTETNEEIESVIQRLQGDE
jgi:hypothetical protein